MDNRRIETAPAWLIALAACALGTSWAVTQQWSAPPERAAVDRPDRTAAPLRWPLAELPPLQASTPSDWRAESLVGAAAHSPGAFAAPGGRGWALGEADLLACAPLRLRIEPRIVLLLPSAPAWRTGDSLPPVPSVAVRRGWAVGPIDSLLWARRAGRAWGDGSGVAGFDVAPWFAAIRGSDSGPRRLAAVGPRLVSPSQLAQQRVTARAYRVVPVCTVPAGSASSIVAYIGNASRGAFPAPVALAEQLDRVAADRAMAPWAWDVAYRLKTLAESGADDQAAAVALAALERQGAEAFARADGLADDAVAVELRRAAYGVSRRTAAWRAEQTQTLALWERRAPASERLADARWAMAAGVYGIGPGGLMGGTPGRTDVLRVAERLERYERAPSARLARSLAESAERLASTGDAGASELAGAIEGNYRNANLRIAIAGDLIRRILPQPEPEVAPVSGRVAGAPIAGQSTTRSTVDVRLTPDASAWRIGLEARGVVASRTFSRGGPAVLGSQGTASFVAKKLVVVSPEGLRALPAVASAQTESQRLVSLRTDYDRVPIVSDYIRHAARDEYGRLRGRARVETESKIERQARTTLDGRVAPRLADIEARYARDVTARLAGLGVEMTPVELRTTETRLVTRVRVAGAAQLGAHTPRVRAPSDSLLSVQVHESMLNNVIEGLALAGETLTTTQLRERIAQRLQLPPRDARATEEAVLRFAADEPVRVRLADGRVELTLALDELAVAGRRHRDFRVHAFYRPEVSGLTAALVQEGQPHIEGRLTTGGRIHLHGVMGKVLADGERIPLVQLTDATPANVSSAAAGLVTSQFVIEDGWLGLALGPQRTERRMALRVGSYAR